MSKPLPLKGSVIRDDDARDLLVEAGRITRCTTQLRPERAHIAALVEELGGALLSVLDRWRTLGQSDAWPEVDPARAVLSRLENAGEAERDWIALFRAE